jgi:uncharacterized protein YndB with AHSA1/START domain
MTEPVIFEVVIAAPAETVWRALRDKDQIRRWFGWDYDGADEEIDYIFFGEASADGETHTLDFGETGRLTVEDGGTSAIVRLVRAAPAGTTSWDGIYDDINEGWLTFVQQLRYFLERHPGEERTTTHIPLTGEPWFESSNQQGVITDQGLVIRTRERVIVSRYG